MPVGLQELHPATVHYPLALLPLSVGADLLGRITGDYALLEMGRRTMPLAAASAGVAAGFGFVAQQAVRAEGQAHDLLVTHRTLNALLLGVTTGMAVVRRRRHRPGLGYLAVGLAAMGTMAYSAYLGGRMAYEHGVGVKPAGGLNEARGPEVRFENVGRAAEIAAGNLAEGAAHAVAETASGELAPALTSADRAFDDERHVSVPRDA